MFKFLLECLVGFKGAIFAYFLCDFFFVFSDITVPYILRVLINRIFDGALIGDVFGLVFLLLFLFFCRIFIVRWYIFFWSCFNTSLKKYIGAKLVDRLIGHSYNFFQNNFIGNLSFKVKEVMSGVPDIIKMFISNLNDLFFLLFSFVAFISIGKLFGLLILVWLSVSIIGTFFILFRLRNLVREAAEAKSATVGTISDILSNINSVRIFSAQNQERHNLNIILSQYQEADQRRDFKTIDLAFFQEICFFFYQSTVLLLLIKGFFAKTINPGDFAFILTTNRSISNVFRSLIKDFSKYNDLLGSIQQSLSVINTPIQIKDLPGAKDLVITKGEITFTDIKFSHNNFLFLEIHNLQIKSGQKVALVGFSGSGKSTFVNLILRIYDPAQGIITIDGQDIKTVTQASLRKNISMIPQDPSLFHRTILENIKYGNPDASFPEIVEAATKAMAHDFISKLPGQYNYVVGEKGSGLSGGERQRIAIARAILKNADILILDEATSQLDLTTEAEIKESLNNFINENKNKTMIFIAHRLSTIVNMDRILVFDKGVIVEDGNHLELLKNKGTYYKLWQNMHQDFLE